MIAVLRWLVMLAGFSVGAAASVGANAWFYYSLAANHVEGMVYAGLGVLVDAFKLTLLEGSFHAWRERKRWVGGIALVAWLFAVPVSLLAAIGFGALVQTEAAGPRAEALRLSASLTTQIAALETEQVDLKAEQAIMDATDETGVLKAQQLLNARGADPVLAEDGRRGPETAKAMVDRGRWITGRLVEITASLSDKRPQLSEIDVPITGGIEHPVFGMLSGLFVDRVNAAGETVPAIIPADLQIKSILFFAVIAELLTATGLLFLQHMAPKMTFRIPRLDLQVIRWWGEVRAAAGFAPPVVQPAAQPVPPSAPVVTPKPAPVAASPAAPPADFSPAQDAPPPEKPAAAPAAPVTALPGVAEFTPSAPRGPRSSVGARRR